MHRSRQSIRFHAMWLFAVLVLPVFLLFGWINYVTMRNQILQDFALIAGQTKGYMTDYIQLAEETIELATASYSNEIQEALLDFEVAYQTSASPETMNLETLKGKYEGAFEFYLLDATGEVLNATESVTNGLRRTFRDASYNTLTAESQNNKTEISPVVLDLNSGGLRKWGVRPSPDHQYMLQVATGDTVLNQYQHLYDFTKLNHTVSAQNQYIQNAAVFTQTGINVSNPTVPIDTEIQENLNRVVASHENLVLYDENTGMKKSEYVYLNHGDDVPDNDTVMLLGYDDSIYHEMLSQNFRGYAIAFLIYILVMMGIIYVITTRFLIKPLHRLSLGMEQVSPEDFKEELPVIRHDQIGQLTHLFNALMGRIRDSMVTRRYLEHVMDSVGDFVFILNEEFEIQQTNRTMRHWFHQPIDSLKGRPLTDILPDFAPEQVREQLTDEVYRVNLEVELEQEGESLLLFATFSNYNHPNGEVKGYICNAKDITKTKELVGRLQDRNRALQQEGERLLKCSSTDDLTGIFNRRYLTQTLFALENMRNGTRFSVIMFDIDHFKRVNDQFGHQTGDKILREVTQIISSSLRREDVLGRYGGEEFLVILPGAELAFAERVAKRICSRVKGCDFKLENMPVTISGGVAEFQRDHPKETIKTLVKRADARLYRAKELGRNRVVTKDESL